LWKNINNTLSLKNEENCEELPNIYFLANKISGQEHEGFESPHKPN